MSEKQFEEAVTLALSLSPLDKVRLVEQVVKTLKGDLESTPHKPKRSLLGLWADLGPAPSAEDIDEARREMWGNFPREDIL
jgi:hypothetical protein